MPKAKSSWRCQTCGAGSARWVGRCGECGEFGTYVEETLGAVVAGLAGGQGVEPVALADVESVDPQRTATGIGELDRVLGGGLVPGSLVLLGGEPGVGKSTLLLQAADALASDGREVLYVCGEESPQQIGLRARRLQARAKTVSLLPELDISAVERRVRESRPSVLVLDSIQTAYDPELDGIPGSVSQVRACTARLMRIAKDLGVITLIVGHVTKEGAIAGPRVLEHMVDVVLYFEGDAEREFRIVRAVKNRFGSATEIGLFEMGEAGLAGVASPSAALLSERATPVAGSAVMVAMEGTRPLLVEIQALVTPSYLPVPRRQATGIDNPRLLQVIAVLERRAGLSFAGQDVLVSVAGGLRVNEPAVDVPLALALASALSDKPVPLHTAAFGELALTGDVRSVRQGAQRLSEAARLGFTSVIAAASGSTDTADNLVACSTVREALAGVR